MMATSTCEDLLRSPSFLAIAAHKDVRVLTRLTPRDHYDDAHEGETLRRGLAVDVEATGLDTASDIVFEVALIPFTYKDDGSVVDVLEDEIYVGFQDPGEPLHPDVVRLTGRTNEFLAGKRFNLDRMTELVGSASLLIAHNADYDRKMLERLHPVFAEKIWGCSMACIDWHAEGAAGARLSDLAALHRLFFDGHTALADARALIHLMAMPLPESGEMPLAVMRGELRKERYAVLFPQTPYELRHQIKPLMRRHGFRWWEGRGEKGYRRLLDRGDAERVGGELTAALERLGCMAKPRVSAVDPRRLFSVEG